MLLFHVATGLRDIHSKNFVHRDIKLENVFLTSDGDYKIGLILSIFTSKSCFVIVLMPFLGDLGLVGEKETTLAMLQSVAGTAFEPSLHLPFVNARFFLCIREYMSPEMIAHKPYDNSRRLYGHFCFSLLA
jgi:serine/threonine protein kinase